MQTRIAFAVVALAAIMLSACGGGGSGGGGSTTNVPQTPQQPQPPQVTVASVQQGPSTRAAAARVATAVPAFGSVTQSANKDGVTGISTDRASTTFDGQTFTLRVDRRSGNDIHLSTAEDYTESYTLDGTPISGHDTAAEGYIIDYKVVETTVAYGAISWLNSNPSDYLAGGYWLHVSGDVLGSGVIDEGGAFVDGPEIALSSRPTMPVRGSATYAGLAEGLYASTYGTDFGAEFRGQTEIGLWSGGMQLTADFSARTIGGCVGCNQAVYVDGVRTDYRLRLGAASFDSRGTFRGSSMTMESATVDITSTTGNWGGMFSNRLDSSGDPRLVAGTLGGELRLSGGTESAFVGAWYGTR